MVTELSAGTARYVAGYVVKKLTGNMEALYDGRVPEFIRMSNRPGIGLYAMDDLASVLLEHGLRDDEDVPAVLRHNGKLLPLGRYLRDALRERVGREKGAHARTIAELEEKVQSVREGAFEASEAYAVALARASQGDRQALEGRYRIFHSRGKL